MKQSFSDKLLGLAGYDKTKAIYLALGFFAMIGSYTIFREMRDSIFMYLVGREYFQLTQILTLFILIPLVFLVSYCIDTFKKETLLYLFSSIYFVGLLICIYFIGHPTIGIGNTLISKWRLFGWIFYFFIEAYPTLLINIYLSFVNTLVSPQKSGQSYSLIIGASKVGGIMFAGLGALYFNKTALSEIFKFRSYMIVGSFLLLIVPIIILNLIKKIPKDKVYGYKASNLVDQKIETEEKKREKNKLKGIFEGLFLLFKYPYALGIFGLVFYWGATTNITCFLLLKTVMKTTNTLGGLVGSLYYNTCRQHIYGLFMILFIVRIAISWFGQRKSLLFLPIATTILILGFLLGGPAMTIALFPIIRALNISFAQGVREGLYIPTSKNIRYKAKSWIDTFGYKSAAIVGAVTTWISEVYGKGSISLYLILLMAIMAIWIFTANYLGKKYEHAIVNNEVIG